MNDRAVYRNGHEHLADELDWLDAGLQTLLDLEGGDPLTDPLAATRGLVVTEEELRNPAMSPAIEDGNWHSYIRFRRDKERQIAHAVRESMQAGVHLPLARMAAALRLSVWECRFLVLCLAAEWDRKYEKWFAYLNDDVTCRCATPDLALRLLCDNEEERQLGRQRLSGNGTLRRLLLETGDQEAAPQPSGRSRLRSPLWLDERTVSCLLETERLDARLAGFVSAYEDEPGALGGSPDDEAAWMLQTLQFPSTSSRDVPFLYVWGPTGAGKRTRLRRLSAARGQRLLIVDADQLPNEPDRLKLTLSRIVREAALTEAALCFAERGGSALGGSGHKALITAAFRDYADFSRRPLLIWTSRQQRRRPELPVPDEASYREAQVGMPDAGVRASVWKAMAAGTEMAAGVEEPAAAAPVADTNEAGGPPLSANERELGDKYRLSPGQIVSAWKQAMIAAEARGDRRPSLEDLETASRKQFNHRLAEMADSVHPTRTWDDLVLHPESLSLLQEACSRFKHRETVLGSWGFGRKLPYGTGIHLMFAGPPGTGKTMAAEIVARELGLELYRIDLSRIVSKYIGETEQRLKELFDEASRSGAILFFDEGDALFGKRTEVKDAHDKYANMEAAYLLQRIEAYDGVTILATNLLQNIDEALFRRMSVVVKFPFPSAADRERIFRAHLPPEAPVSDDLDLAFLASRLEVSGGHIKNIVLAAAFLAAAEQAPIGMPHMVRAAWQELRKMGKIFVKESFAPYFPDTDDKTKEPDGTRPVIGFHYHPPTP